MLDNKLFPNQFVNIELLVDTLRDVITVPTAAIQRGAPGTFVYLISSGNKVSVKKVTLGPCRAITSLSRMALPKAIKSSSTARINCAKAPRLRSAVRLLPRAEQREGPSNDLPVRKMTA